jgi:RNA recognition motif-containing protein
MDDIYVGNIPQGTKYDDIRKLFEIHGEISRIKMHKTFAFVSYTNKAIVKDVINIMVQTTLHNILLNIKPARKRFDRNQIDVLVSFLALKPKIKVTEQAIETIFSEYGTIREIDIRKWIYDENTELCKGFAFVRYNDITKNEILQNFGIIVDDVEYSVTPSNRTSPCHLYQETTPKASIYYNDQYNPLMGYNMNHRYFWTANIRNLH